MIALKLLLYPFALIYNGIMRARNHLYDIGHKSSFEFETAVIAVGNLNVGGSGKTPMVEYLIRLLSNKFPTVTLSRGYKRETSGFRMATNADTAQSIGDEPLQLFRKFSSQVQVAVGEDRVFAIPNILHNFPETRALILDDAFQQRAIRPVVNILLTSYERPFFVDHVIPFGRLRESRSGAVRANAIVVTKCPEGIASAEQQQFEKAIKRYAPNCPVFFSGVEYAEPVAARAGHRISANVILVTGIADGKPFNRYCTSRFTVIKHFEFADHHSYSLNDLEEIERACQRQAGEVIVLTTEKDMARLDCPEFAGFLERNAWFSLPISQVFLKDGSKFDELVLDAVARFPKP